MGHRRFVSLKLKTILLLTGVFLLLIGGTILIEHYIMLDRITQLENDRVEEHLIRAKNTLSQRAKILDSLVYDWAIWDDTYAFIQDHSETYIEKNLGAEVFVNLDLDFMVFTDINGEVVFASQLNPDQTLSPISKGLSDLITQSNVTTSKNPDFGFKGIVDLPEGPVMISTSPILTSKSEGPLHGHLFVGFFLNQAFIDEISQQLEIKLMLEPYSHILTNNDNEPSTMDFRILSETEIVGKSILFDIKGEPVYQILIQMDRDIYAIGKEGVIYVILFISLLSILCTSILIVYMHDHFLNRIHYISDEVGKIGEARDFSRRLKPDAINDEILTVTHEINEMLDNLQKAEAELAFNANHDALTGLPNRRLLRELMNHAMLRAQRNDKKLAVLFLDLDEFKLINDSKGHEFGDEILKETTSRLVTCLRKSDHLARLGGDEFIVILEDFEHLDGVSFAADKIRNALHSVFTIKMHDFYLTTSIGISIYPDDGTDTETLIKNADLALYKAKEYGKDQFVYCSSFMKSAISENMKLSSLLHRAIEHDELMVHYQPQLDGLTHEIMGFEALVRWENPEIGHISPNRFIPIAEQTGLIIPIGEWVLRTACAQGVQWQKAGYPEFRIAVNLSLKQFQASNLIQTIATILTETGLKPALLDLEITETVAMKEKSQITDILNQMKALGVSIAIDDFGTEYSSLNHLKNLPFDSLKIASPFIQGIGISHKDEAITASIIHLAKNLGMSVTAEGVENETQLNFLSAHACDTIQGFYFHKPLSAQDIGILLSNRYPQDSTQPLTSFNPDES